ncbi:MAG: ABC transporter substrate-binding protein [Clostridia bacterium]|nr:ABC transporter substrate-binding protein [Clostridia bacterium]
MKRILAVVLVLMMLASVTGALAVNEDVEGKITIYTSMYRFVYEGMKDELAKEFPNLEVEFYYAGTGTLISQIAGEMGEDRSGALGCDMLLVAEPAYSLELKDYGYLHAYDAPAKESLRFPYDEEGYWYPVRVCNMVLAYNPEKYTPAELPKTFKEFAEDPGLKDKISMGNPLTSGTAFAAVSALTSKYGYEYFDALRANNVMIESGSTALAKLESGECKAIMILEESVLQRRHDDGSKLACIYPEDGNIMIPSTVMIVSEEKSANANLEACEAVHDWLLSEAGQRFIVSGFMHSVLKDFPEIPYDSVATEGLIESDMGVDWERTYHERDAINDEWNKRVTQ